MKQNWEIRTLSEIGKVFNGNSINEKVKKDNYTGLDEGLPFIATKDVGFDSVIDYDNGVKIPFNEKSQFKIAPPNTPLICAEGGSAGRKIGFTKQAVCFGNKLFALVPNKNVNSKFLFYYYFSSSFQKYFSTEMAGIIGGVSMNKFKGIEIILPPFSEQQRIVPILDEAFVAIAKAKSNAKQNLKNAKELFESYLQGVFENGNWEEKSIQEVTKVINGYAFPSKDFNSMNTIKSIKITNVGVKEFVEEVDNYLPEKFKDTLKEVQVREGNIVIALTRTIISAGLKVAIVPASYDGALLNQRVAALVPNERIINQRYLYNFLTTDGVAKYVLAHVNTLMQPNLSINDLKNLPVPCPSMKEQSGIVKKLDRLRNEVNKLKSVYQKKIDDLEELKKSILQKAFSGELNTTKDIAV